MLTAIRIMDPAPHCCLEGDDDRGQDPSGQIGADRIILGADDRECRSGKVSVIWGGGGCGQHIESGGNWRIYI